MATIACIFVLVALTCKNLQKTCKDQEPLLPMSHESKKPVQPRLGKNVTLCDLLLLRFTRGYINSNFHLMVNWAWHFPNCVLDTFEDGNWRVRSKFILLSSNFCKEGLTWCRNIVWESVLSKISVGAWGSTDSNCILLSSIAECVRFAHD